MSGALVSGSLDPTVQQSDRKQHVLIPSFG